MGTIHATTKISEDELEEIAELVLESVDGLDSSRADDAVAVEVMLNVESQSVAGVYPVDAYIEISD